MRRDTSRRARSCRFIAISFGPVLSALALLAGCGATNAETDNNAPSNAQSGEAPPDTSPAPSPAQSPESAAQATPVDIIDTPTVSQGNTPLDVEESAPPNVDTEATKTTPDRCGCTVLIPSTKADPVTYDDCIVRENDEWVLTPDVRQKIKFPKNVKLVELLSECGPFYLKKNGLLRKSHFFDNGCDPFSEGRTRVVQKGKYGYMDKNLKIVVVPVYEYAYPFESGYGRVCNDCTTTSVEEHYITACDTCGLVDRTGRMVLPLGSTKAEMDRLLDNPNTAP